MFGKPKDTPESTEAHIPRTLTYFDSQGERRVVSEDDLSSLERPLVVLGEPGMGKTHLLHKLAKTPDFEFVTAKGLLRRSETRAEVRPNRVLVIDALDEIASARADDPIDMVLRQLGLLGHPPFILSCRSADWRSAIARHDIGEDYGRVPLELILNPFTEDEAYRWLSGKVPQERAHDTIRGLTQRGLSALFGNPLMLKLVAQLAEQNGTLPETRAELFSGACDRLCAEQNPRYQTKALGQLGRVAALDAAGAAFAALLLTGSEAISREVAGHLQEGDLRVADIEGLPEAEAIDTVLGSLLFQRPGEHDRFAPLHRTIAEYLGARWLAAHATPETVRRIMALLTYNGGVPASLRGMHAWLAHFSPLLAPHVIQNDCYGVLRYGDADGLSVTEGSDMLDALKALSIRNPFFRSEDWSRHSARGLMHPELAEKIRALALAPNSAMQLRVLLLESLRGSSAASLLRDDLVKLMMDDGTNDHHYNDRLGAAEVLVGLNDPELNWSTVVQNLCHSANPDAKHLAIDILITRGLCEFSAELIADAALAYLGPQPELDSSAHDIIDVGPLYLLSRQLPELMIAPVLDLFAQRNQLKRSGRWQSDYALTEFVTSLISRKLNHDPPPPLQLIAWLRILPARHSQVGSERHGIGEFIRNHPDVRRAIQEHVLLVELGDDTPWERAWELQNAEAGLFPDPDDVVALLGSPTLSPLSSLPVQERWKDIVRLSARRDGLPSAVAITARRQATGDAELESFLADLEKPKVPKWELDQRKRDATRVRRRNAKWAEHRKYFENHLDDIRAGELSFILPLSRAYRGDYVDMDSKSSPYVRIREWLGSDILDSARIGFEAVLHRSDLPTSTQIAESYSQSKRWNFIVPIMVGLLERIATGRGLDDVSLDVILSGRLGCEWELIGDADGGGALRDALDAKLMADGDAFKAYARQLIEPQLKNAADTEHIIGLYQLTRQGEVAQIVTALAEEWFASFPDMPLKAEIELIDHLARFQAWSALRAAAVAREAAGYRTQEQRLTWFAVEFLVDCSKLRADLTNSGAIDPNLMWHIRRRDGLRRAHPSDGKDALSRIVWLIETFRYHHPAVERPPGTTSGDENPWEATGYLQAAIRELASDTSDAAIAALTKLRDDVDDGYSAAIRKGISDQIQARREADFKPLRLEDLAAVMRESRPATIQDLRAVALDALEVLQRQLRGDDVDSKQLFYKACTPLDENRCRNVLTTLMRGRLPDEIECVPERAMPDGKRVDLALVTGALQLPLEAKGQWNPRLWTAAVDQLDGLYTKEWRASGAGIYLVFWFGPSVQDNQKLKKPPKGSKLPVSPDDLASALSERLPEHRRADLSIVVLDLSL
jgi:hypothetical protein